MSRAGCLSFAAALGAVVAGLAGCADESAPPPTGAGGDTAAPADGGLATGGRGGTTPGTGGGAAAGGGAGGTGGPADALPPAPDGGGPADTSAACAPAAHPDLGWLPGYQMDVLARLTGKSPYAPGRSLADRGSVENRRVARDLLVQMLTDAHVTPALHEYGSGANVFAILPSTTGAIERVVVGAHYDTVANTPGASDNATGVAVVLATARAMAERPCRSRAFVFVLFDQEEIGLVGSKAFATKLAGDGIPVHTVHSIDQLGWDEDQDHLIELERGDDDVRALYRAAVMELGLDVPLTATRSGSTDHESFRPQFNAIGVTEEYVGGDTSPHRHRATDVYDTINQPYLNRGTQVVIQVMADLATTAPH
jgi:hypothetical protein